MRNILLSLFVCCMFIACEEEKLEPYTGNDTVQFYTTNFDEDIVVEYSWGMALDPNAEYDTCWIPVQTMGRAKNYDRYLKLVQEKAVGWDYVYDHVGNIVDSLSYEIPNQAVEGKHYVAFDDPGLRELLKIPAIAFRVDVPVVMRKDPEMTEKLTLLIRLVDTETVKVGDPQFTKCQITIE